MFFIFYGPEGSGKGTQAKLLSKKLKLPRLVSGDLVRETARKDKGYLGKICEKSLYQGYYVPDSEMFVLWKRRLKMPDVQKGFILDGFPRNLKQVKFLARKLEKYGKKIDLVFYLKVREKESIRRLLKRGRRLGNGELHDSPERIRSRLREYKKSEAKVLKFYKKRGVLAEINGEGRIERIHQDIMKKIAQKIKNETFQKKSSNRH